MDRRKKALIMLIIAIIAVIAFGTGITLCIDWGGASAPPRDYGQPPAAVALPPAAALRAMAAPPAEVAPPVLRG